MKTFLLKIVTPYGLYFQEEVEFLAVRSDKANYGVMPGLAPMITTVTVCPIHIIKDGVDTYYAIGGGVLEVKKEYVTLLVRSIERSDEIDLVRAQEAKDRAEARLKAEEQKEKIDIARALLALKKANNRIDVFNNHN